MFPSVSVTVACGSHLRRGTSREDVLSQHRVRRVPGPCSRATTPPALRQLAAPSLPDPRHRALCGRLLLADQRTRGEPSWFPRAKHVSGGLHRETRVAGAAGRGPRRNRRRGRPANCAKRGRPADAAGTSWFSASPRGIRPQGWVGPSRSLSGRRPRASRSGRGWRLGGWGLEALADRLAGSRECGRVVEEDE
jgi:hypothetical protein